MLTSREVTSISFAAAISVISLEIRLVTSLLFLAVLEIMMHKLCCMTVGSDADNGHAGAHNELAMDSCNGSRCILKSVSRTQRTCIRYRVH